MSNKTHTIAPTRVDEKLYQLVQQVAQENDLKIAEVVRLALEDYCTPGVWTSPTPSVILPIVGTISDKGIEWNSSEVKK